MKYNEWMYYLKYTLTPFTMKNNQLAVRTVLTFDECLSKTIVHI